MHNATHTATVHDFAAAQRFAARKSATKAAVVSLLKPVSKRKAATSARREVVRARAKAAL